jgi:asparagine synthase (glutamine-hydrolysing)
MADTAAQVGADTILTGVGADDMLDVLPFHIAELIRRGRIGHAWREARRWATATNSSPWLFIYQFGLVNLVPARLRAGLRALLRGGSAGLRNLGEGTVAPWVRPEFARTHGMWARGVRNLREIFGACRPVSLSLALSSLRAIHGDGPRWFLAAPHGILLSHPFFDVRVVRMGLGIQARFRQEPGKPKPLLVHALRDVLPKEIRTRRRKGHYNEAYFTGLSRNLPALETMIHKAPDDFGLLDKQSLVQHLRQTSLGIEHCAAGSMRLDLTLSLVKWLSMRKQWETLPLEPPAQTVCLPRRQMERAGS